MNDEDRKLLEKLRPIKEALDHGCSVSIQPGTGVWMQVSVSIQLRHPHYYTPSYTTRNLGKSVSDLTERCLAAKVAFEEKCDG